MLLSWRCLFESFLPLLLFLNAHLGLGDTLDWYWKRQLGRQTAALQYVVNESSVEQKANSSSQRHSKLSRGHDPTWVGDVGRNEMITYFCTATSFKLKRLRFGKHTRINQAVGNQILRHKAVQICNKLVHSARYCKHDRHPTKDGG
ncbi:hypothetical protein BJ878DRAFT_551808 [Calycina marina]|uniref:Secreted protein n=1 Tax=Calycina marina TaxID=1763456 RepID=A0A9P7ZAB6_9HELO|nr:hypothetical protein BJ878DRAFT_551808 [Calycina marina]